MKDKFMIQAVRKSSTPEPSLPSPGETAGTIAEQASMIEDDACRLAALSVLLGDSLQAVGNAADAAHCGVYLLLDDVRGRLMDRAAALQALHRKGQRG